MTAWRPAGWTNFLQVLKHPPLRQHQALTNQSSLCARFAGFLQGYFDDSISYDTRRVTPGFLEKVFVAAATSGSRSGTEVNSSQDPENSGTLDTVICGTSANPNRSRSLPGEEKEHAFVKRRPYAAKAPHRRC